jgi:hypothetical protein
MTMNSAAMSGQAVLASTSGYAGVVLETVHSFTYTSGSSGYAVSSYLAATKPTFLQYFEYHALSGNVVSSAITVYKNSSQGYSSVILSQNTAGVTDLIYTPPYTPLMLLSGDSIAVRCGNSNNIQFNTLIVAGYLTGVTDHHIHVKKSLQHEGL